VLVFKKNDVEHTQLCQEFWLYFHIFTLLGMLVSWMYKMSLYQKIKQNMLN